jgi:hypothetical protein
VKDLHRVLRRRGHGGAGAGHARCRRRENQGETLGGHQGLRAGEDVIDMGVHRLGVGFFFTEAICGGKAAAKTAPASGTELR